MAEGGFADNGFLTDLEPSDSEVADGDSKIDDASDSRTTLYEIPAINDEMDGVTGKNTF